MTQSLTWEFGFADKFLGYPIDFDKPNELRYWNVGVDNGCGSMESFKDILDNEDKYNVFISYWSKQGYDELYKMFRTVGGCTTFKSRNYATCLLENNMKALIWD
jgi:hypothetical protein